MNTRVFNLFLCVCTFVTLRSASFAQAPTSPAPPSNTSPASAQADYKLGSGDSFDVVVANHAELSGSFLVPEGGSVLFPELGPINVIGKTLAELNKTLTDRYNKILYDARVTTIFKLRRVSQVSVLGDVAHAGVVALTGNIRVSDAISTAGGLLPDIRASEVMVTVTHSDGTKTVFSMSGLLDGTPGDNPVLKEGDAVFVDTGEFTVYVIGQVVKPGSTPLKRGAGILEAIAAAGGTTDLGAPSRIRVLHADGSEEVVNIVPALSHGESQKLPPVRQGDVITVPQNSTVFSVLGHVLNPGVFPLPEDHPITLAQAIGLAHGDVRGAVSRIKIASMQNGVSITRTYNFTKYLVKADPSANPVIHAGDVVFVPETDRLANDLTIQAFVAVAYLIRGFSF
jgi:protein involved in polysaccharide export with SLBB domain